MRSSDGDFELDTLETGNGGLPVHQNSPAGSTEDGSSDGSWPYSSGTPSPTSSVTPPDGSPKKPGVLVRMPKGDGLAGLRRPLLSEFDLTDSAGDNEAAKLNCLSRTRKKLASAYDVFAQSTVGTVIRAAAMSVPQSLILGATFELVCGGLVAPLVRRASSEKNLQDYYNWSERFAFFICGLAFISDTTMRLRSHYKNLSSYSSYNLFRLRAALVGAAFGGFMMHDILHQIENPHNHPDQHANAWLNLGLSIPCVLFPAFLRFAYFEHDLVPSPLNRDKKATIVPRKKLIRSKRQKMFEEEQTMIGRHKQSIFNNRAFNSIGAGATAAGAALMFDRAIISYVFNGNPWLLSWHKVASAPLAWMIGSAVMFNKGQHPKAAFRWRQGVVSAGDSALALLAVASWLPGNTGIPDFWWKSAVYPSALFALLVGLTQARRLIRKEPTSPAIRM